MRPVPEPMIDDAPLEGGYYDSSEVPAPDINQLPGRKSKFTAEAQAKILEDIEAGAFAHVAAKASGITHATLIRWRNDPNKAEWAAKLAIAEGKARVSAETRVHREKPTLWLRLGPGRDFGDPSQPGWTAPAKRVEGKHAHSHTLEPPARQPIDLSRLSKSEIATLAELTAKMLPATGNHEAIEVEATPTED